jgi:hypothetical protein
MPNEKLPLLKALKKNILPTIILTLAEFASLIFTTQIALSIGPMIGYSFSNYGIWAVKPNFYKAGIGFMFFFTIYIFFRFVIKYKIHLQIITSLSIIIICLAPSVVDAYNPPRAGAIAYWFDTLAIDIGGYFIFQLFIFGAFAIAISLLDRHTALKAWKRIIIAFALALPVGALASWAVWSQMEKLYIEMRGHDFALLAKSLGWG